MAAMPVRYLVIGGLVALLALAGAACSRSDEREPVSSETSPTVGLSPTARPQASPTAQPSPIVQAQASPTALPSPIV
jgi:hypothetical protein